MSSDLDGPDPAGRLTAAIAHDLNNLLQVVTGYMEGVTRHVAASRDARLIRQVGAMAEAAGRATALTRQLLAVSRGPEADPVDRDAPAPGMAVPPGDAPASGGPAPDGRARILVVDDRAEVAELARTMLEDAGYAVEVARDGQDALAKLARGFDLLFSDLVMPGNLDGVGLAREAQKRHPGLKVLLTTGLAEASADRTGARGAEFDTIAKPYRRAELARTVRRVLGGPPGLG